MALFTWPGLRAAVMFLLLASAATCMQQAVVTMLPSWGISPHGHASATQLDQHAWQSKRDDLRSEKYVLQAYSGIPTMHRTQ